MKTTKSAKRWARQSSDTPWLAEGLRVVDAEGGLVATATTPEAALLLAQALRMQALLHTIFEFYTSRSHTHAYREIEREIGDMWGLVRATLLDAGCEHVGALPTEQGAVTKIEQANAEVRHMFSGLVRIWNLCGLNPSSAGDAGALATAASQTMRDHHGAVVMALIGMEDTLKAAKLGAASLAAQQAARS